MIFYYIISKIVCRHDFPQFADICAALAVSVGAGVRVTGGGEGADGCVGVVLAGRRPAGESEDTADPEGGCAGAGGRARPAGALRGRVAGPVQATGGRADLVREPHQGEHGHFSARPRVLRLSSSSRTASQ